MIRIIPVGLHTKKLGSATMVMRNKVPVMVMCVYELLVVTVKQAEIFLYRNRY